MEERLSELSSKTASMEHSNEQFNELLISNLQTILQQVGAIQHLITVL